MPDSNKELVRRLFDEVFNGRSFEAGVVPPIGKRFSAHQSHWYRVENGKLAEHWAVRDDLATMMQLGILQRPGPPS